MNPCDPAMIKRLKAERAVGFGWAHFKHWLVRQGIIKTPDDDCPFEWQEAYLKAIGRKRMGTYGIKISTTKE